MRGIAIVAFTALLGLGFLAEVRAVRGAVVPVEVGELQFAPPPIGK
ncbi:MAG TPA: hypothetical protein VD838_06740 [Anaeromyxobacteraceae bacterium]|nr:hypothetical protein [Anaeromyxobacteraceae bacterium]